MRTMIAIPCMDMVNAVFMRSLLAMDKVGEVSYEMKIGTLVYDSRNQLLMKALAGGYDRILWFDSDMEIPKDTMRILSEDLDAGHGIVSGLYIKRIPPFTPTIFKTCEIQQLEDQPEKLIPVTDLYQDYPKNDIFEVAACGFGCVMMDVATVRKITDKLGVMLFMPTAGFGEDFSFCLRASYVGEKIYCDSRVRLGHIGYRAFTVPEE